MITNDMRRASEVKTRTVMVKAAFDKNNYVSTRKVHSNLRKKLVK
jgi:hypothetical protein